MNVQDFDDFYEEVHGYPPFPWQGDLVRQIAERGEWPALVDVPTGLGKTSLLDIAVFLCALDAAEPTAVRVGRRRVFFVVDRRVVVDQAAQHAGKIVSRLSQAPRETVSGEVAERLRALSGPSAKDGLLPVVKMRGGVTWDAAWLSRPDLPGIVTGTVDQVGSRLFFRGYGVSSRRWPIDAALVGTDSVVLVDEAHLATALTDSLKAGQSYDHASHSLEVPKPLVVQLTATAREAGPGWTPDFDEQAHLANPVAARRLTAAKTLRLVECAKAATVRTLADAASQSARDPGDRVLVVCNTIDRARAVHTQLSKELRGELEPLLLIGRSRQVDREPIVQEALRLFGAGRADTPERAILVATQTVEVGIDLDATALITESASWEALVQRIGRVNRRGEHENSDVVVIHDDDAKPPVYGQTRLRTADFLRSQLEVGDGALDVSPLALRHLTPDQDVLSPLPITPLLLPAHLDAWTRTAPAPVNDAPLDPYLHGLKTGVAPVSVAWRDGLLDSDENRVGQLEADLAVNAIPLRTEECVEIPISALRRWLVGDKQAPASDWDVGDDWDAVFDDRPTAHVLRRSAQADGSSTWIWAQGSAIRPGDLVVAPSERGGLDQYGWAPSSTQKVVDIAELVALERARQTNSNLAGAAKGYPSLRLDEGLSYRLGIEPPPETLWKEIHEWRVSDDPDSRATLAASCADRVRNWLRSSIPVHTSPWSHDDRWAALKEAMETGVIQASVPTSGQRTETEHRRFLLPVAVMRAMGAPALWWEASDDSADGTSHLGTDRLDGQAHPVGLSLHLEAVSKRAKEIVDKLGLPPTVGRTVIDAARWHDLGKVDPRFQAMLRGGDRLRVLIAPEPLAKSGMQLGDWRARHEAHSRSGLPAKARHEAWSEVLVSAYLASINDAYPGDSELLLHLIASHHGNARPFLPPVVDHGAHDLVADVGGNVVTAALPRRVDLDHAERFEVLNGRYGRWGLALLESIVRCADMTVSGEGS